MIVERGIAASPVKWVSPCKCCSLRYCGRAMDTSLDTTFFAILLTATFAAALIAGLAGFAFGLVAAALWLYILTPCKRRR